MRELGPAARKPRRDWIPIVIGVVLYLSIFCSATIKMTARIASFKNVPHELIVAHRSACG